MKKKKNYLKIFFMAVIGFLASTLLYGYGKFQQAQAIFLAVKNDVPNTCALGESTADVKKEVSAERAATEKENAGLFISCGGFF